MSLLAFLAAIFAPGILLGLWLGWRAVRPGPLRRNALLARAGAALWGLAAWLALFLWVPATETGPLGAELLDALPKVVALAAVDSLPFFAIGWLLARRRGGGGSR